MLNIDELIDKIIKEYDLYKGQKINEKFFLEMYNKYGKNFTELEFADMLGIKKSTYYAFNEKNNKEKQKDKIDQKNITVIILLNRKLTAEENDIELLKLVNKYDLHKGKKIDYTFFRKMYKDLKTFFTEVEFANFIGISKYNLKCIKNSNQKARVLGNMTLKEEMIEKIRENLISKYEGKEIYYEEGYINRGKVSFIEIYKPYKLYFTELEFAQLIGISEKNLFYAKNRKANPKIKDIKKVEAVKILKTQIEEGRYYSKEEIEEMIKKVNISLTDFINYYINKGRFFDFSIYEDAIEKNKRLWIGETRLSNEQIIENIEMFNRISRTVVNEINRRYGEYYLEDDMKSNVMIYIITQCGDLYYNFKYDVKLMERMIWLRAREFTRINYIQERKKDIGKISIDSVKIGNNNDDEFINFEQMKNGLEERISGLFQNYLMQGYDKETATENISKIFNIPKGQVIDIIKQYLLSQGKVRQRNGKYEIGER